MYKKYTKRTIDLVFSLTALIVFLPLGILAAILIKLDSNGPIVFSHLRYGQNKKPFRIYKFRSMAVDAPAEAPTNSLQNATAHITRVGKIMRKLSLDELPQLINVIRGEMSIVGPRPVILVEADLITEREKYGANDCKPGITGWAQVNGRDEVSMKTKAKMDGEYADKIGILMDIKCILLTIYAVVSIKGHREGSDEANENAAWNKDAYRTKRENI
jgi:O-antigen biosynthesis protein WbqP